MSTSAQNVGSAPSATRRNDVKHQLWMVATTRPRERGTDCRLPPLVAMRMQINQRLALALRSLTLHTPDSHATCFWNDPMNCNTRPYRSGRVQGMYRHLACDLRLQMASTKMHFGHTP
jgi:hypothetical protein